MKRVARTSRVEQMLIAAFLGLAGYAASSLTSIGHPETSLTEKAHARQPAGPRAQHAPESGNLRLDGRG